MTISAATRAARVPEEDLCDVIRHLMPRYAARIANQAVLQINGDPTLSEWDRYALALLPLERVRTWLVEFQSAAARTAREAFDERTRRDAEASSTLAPPPPGPALDLADALAALFAGTPTPTTEAPATQD